MNVNLIFYFFIFLNYISGQGFGEQVFSYSKKCLKVKSTYILPLFLASNFYFFTMKKAIVERTNICIEDYAKILKKLDSDDDDYDDKVEHFNKFNFEFVALNKMMGKSFLSYIVSVFHYFKISDLYLGKEWASLGWINRKNKMKDFSQDKEQKLLFKSSQVYKNEMAENFLRKLFLDFLILSCYFYPKLLKSRSLSFGLHINFLVNFFIKIIQKNRITFLTKLFLINNSENIEKLKKEFQDEANTIDSLVCSEKKKLRENIFYQNLFVLPIVNQVALAHYSFKNYPSHLICFPGFCLLALSNHFFCHSVVSRFFKNPFHKLLFHLPLSFLDLFIFYYYFAKDQKLKKQKEEKNRLLPGEERTSYYEDRFVIEVCDLNANITTTTESYQPT
jgi:hypothetical protein